ncbi:MAG: excinuclease ABC subunit A, partial [Myxococcota bacterium]|nr:excinuclease ABC subunit A [Myxococcota bacterium]
HFSFNSQVGACTTCTGLGRADSVDPDLLLPRPQAPLAEALDARVASVLFRSTRTRALVAAVFERFGTSQDTAVEAWPETLREAMLHGLDTPLSIHFSRSRGRSRTTMDEELQWRGIIPTVEGWSGRSPRLRRGGPCPSCGGARLRAEVLAHTIGDQNIAQVCGLTVDQAHEFWSTLALGRANQTIAASIVEDILGKLGFLRNVGLGYLDLDRAADTLSGGEAQRIRLATQLGARLTGVIYVLDEPTVGLHTRDTRRLLTTLFGLRDLGNTVLVVEHDREVILAADHLLDLGPGAGEHGGRLIAAGSPREVAVRPTPTGAYLNRSHGSSIPTSRRSPESWIQLPESRLHNLKDIAPRFPLGCLTVVTGVSGSGKSTLVMDVLAPWLEQQDDVPRVTVVNQKPLGRTPRSTPATSCKLMDP